jgi:hypothetical protein
MAKTKVVYIAGAYSADTLEQQHKNVNHAVEATHRLLCEGYCVFCPIITYGYFDLVYDLPYETYLRTDLEILKRCDCIYLLNNWRTSYGARCEKKLAALYGLEVIYE